VEHLGVVSAFLGERLMSQMSVWTTPGGGKVAWIADPDGNILSLTQFQ